MAVVSALQGITLLSTSCHNLHSRLKNEALLQHTPTPESKIVTRTYPSELTCLVLPQENQNLINITVVIKEGDPNVPGCLDVVSLLR